MPLAGGAHCNGDDLVWVSYRLATLDLVDVFHSLDHAAPNRILPVEKGCVIETDEELAVGTIGMVGASHGHGAALVRDVTEFRFQILTGAAAACSCRIAGLSHETFDNAVKNNAVIKSLARKFLDASDVVWSKIGQQLNHNAAVGRLQNQPIFIILGCHVLLFPGAG